jgi:crotonobetaine/carnitine-CoA ligase
MTAAATTKGWSRDDEHTIPELLARRLATEPDAPYLDVCGTACTAAEMADAAGRLVAGFTALGIEPGDRVAALVENSPEAMLFWFGTVLGGAIAVPINTAYKGEYLRHQLADSGARVVVVQGDLLARVAAVTEQLPDLGHVVVIGEPEIDVAELRGVTVHDWAALLARDPAGGGPGGLPDVAIRPGDLGTFIYTGGTTGPSKGCMLSHNYHEVLARQIGICWRRTADDVVWTPLPLFHFNAIVTAVLGPLVYGGRGAVYRRFSVSNFWPEMNRTGATIVSLLGSLAFLLAQDEDRPEMPRSGAPGANTSLRLVGAAPLPPELDARIRERFGVATFSGAFGLTEASLVAWQPFGVDNKPGAAGIINRDFFDLRIFDDDDHEVPRGETGEIVVRPLRPHVMYEGYWGNAAATVKAHRNLWFHTGDIGKVDDDDYLFFVDRKADYLRRRGENISSFEVERVVGGHEAVAEAVVCAVPSEVTEDDLKLTVTVVEGRSVTEEELFRWCIDQLPYFALPRYVEIRADLPRSPVGRVLKRELRAEGVTAATWDAEAAGITYDKR